MSSSESSPVDKSGLPSFIAPFDGSQTEIDEAERIHVAQIFTSLVQDLQLSHIGAIQDISETDRPHSSLSLRLNGEGDSFWTAHVRNKDPESVPLQKSRPKDTIIQQIVIQEFRDGHGRESSSYKLSADGTVRRVDLGDIYADTLEHARSGESDALTIPAIMDQIRAAQLGMTRARLEEDMRLNNQPIGVPEMQGLEDFMLQPEWYAEV